ncbi:hypothetical protein L9F63_017301 [Diploptera punctata]|uniref:Tetratricopeptide repeat protein 39B n=1 Tax=Diploptera punctata TaxID=6984 RepID=A0AAD8EGW4_DIPPU|nr:hypothetical protein L9F63_017301 [Diploptera punctata]
MDQTDSDQEYHDALETQPVTTTKDLETSIEDAKVAVEYFLNNEYNKAKDILLPRIQESMYHAIANASITFIEGILTYENKTILEACEVSKQCVSLCNSFRRKITIGQAFGKLIGKKNYDLYSPIEIHAELCYAESLLLNAMISFLEDETFASFIKGGFKIQSCYNSYKECNNILLQRHWGDEGHKKHFESGVRLGMGMFNIMISLLPSRIIKLLEFIGFSGNKQIGLNDLKAGYNVPPNLRHIVCAMALLGFHLGMECAVCHEETDIIFCEDILKKCLQLYPQGMLFLYFNGRMELIKGNAEEAINCYTMAWKSQDKWKGFHDICFWELFWVNVIKCEWRIANTFMDKLLCHSRWSKTIYAYHKASSFIMLQDQITSEEMEEMVSLMRTAPQFKQQIAGKSLPIEKFIIKKTERFFAQDKILILPVIELLYIWNLIKLVGRNKELIEKIYDLCNEAMNNDILKKASNFQADNQALILSLKGACLHHMKSTEQANQCLSQVLSLEKEIKDDTYLIPYAMVELAHLYKDEGNFTKALSLLERVKKKYHGYSMELRLHFKINSLQEAMSGDNATSSSPAS